MGVTYSLLLAKPEKWERACARFAGPVLLNDAASVNALCADLGIDPSSSQSAELALESLRYGEDAGPCAISLFEEAITERHFDLDKSLREERLGRVFSDVPGLRPLRRLLDFKVDIQTPQMAVDSDGGLVGVFARRSLDRFKPAIDCIRTESDLDYYPIPHGWLARLFSADRRLHAALSLLRDEYNWHHWQQIRSAINEALAGDLYLGISFSP